MKHKKHKTISIKEEYGILDLAGPDQVEKLIHRMKVPDSNEIILDLSGCYIDYPYVSDVLDKVLYCLDKKDSKKNLKVMTDIHLPLETLYNLLFLGSTFLRITDKFKPINSEWNYVLEELSKNKNITIEIILV